MHVYSIRNWKIWNALHNMNGCAEYIRSYEQHAAQPSMDIKILDEYVIFHSMRTASTRLCMRQWLWEFKHICVYVWGTFKNVAGCVVLAAAAAPLVIIVMSFGGMVRAWCTVCCMYVYIFFKQSMYIGIRYLYSSKEMVKNQYLTQTTRFLVTTHIAMKCSYSTFN